MSLLSTLPVRPPDDDRPRYPNGWQSIGFSEDVPKGSVGLRRAFGRDLVVYRGESGQVTVADAYCPHMGANLVDGRMDGDMLLCPFHKWGFDEQGQCVHMPYGDKVPQRARLKTMPTKEVNGFIFIWHDREGRAPAWDIPVQPVTYDPDYRLVDRREYMFRAHPQDISENGADFGHFVTIHGWDDVALLFRPDGPAYRLDVDTSDVSTGYGEKGEVGVDAMTVGPGYTYSHYSGEIDWLEMSCFTPVDEERLYLHHRYYAHARVSDDVIRPLIDAVDAQWQLDMKIWERKRFSLRPALSDGDGPIGTFRRWYAQFY